MSLSQLLRRNAASPVLLEGSVFTEAVGTVDRDAGLIHGVKILGRHSDNGREYLPSAMREAAHLYENAEVNIDHPAPRDASRERGVLEGWGKLTNVVAREDGLYGDLRFLREHPSTPVLLERIDAGFGIGLSHNAEGRGKTVKGKLLVEAITRVRSVDVVTRPATNKNLFESRENTMTLGDLARALRNRPEASLLLEMVEADAAMAEMPVEADAEGSSDDQIKEAFANAVKTVFNDDSLDAKATLKKMAELVKAYEKLSGKAEEATEPEPDAQAQESARPAPPSDDLNQLREQLSRQERQIGLLSVMQDYGLTRESLGAAKHTALSNAASVPDMVKLVEGWSLGYRTPYAARRAPVATPSLKLSQIDFR